jgi:hypothetical protein
MVHFMKLSIIVLYPDATEPAKECEFKFGLCIGSGVQTVKWLALAAAQRFRSVSTVSAAFQTA